MDDIKRMMRSGRDPVFSTGYGRMCWTLETQNIIPLQNLGPVVKGCISRYMLVNIELTVKDRDGAPDSVELSCSDHPVKKSD